VDTSFAGELRTRGAADYADFLLPHLREDFHLLDVGCGRGTITLGLAEHVARVVGIDTDEEEFADALRFSGSHGMRNVDFVAGDARQLDFDDERFDACLCHSMLEAVDAPGVVLGEIKRVLRPGGVLGAACVDYGGLLLAGPHAELLRRFYSIRECVWQLERVADPYLGRRLRGLLEAAGFAPVIATAKYFSYGAPDAVEAFGLDRAADCGDTWYARSAVKHGLASRAEIDSMKEAWTEWSASREAYAAFAWCRGVAWKPG
jgi:SAM-dependent methyltransferase